ncbi:MAG: nicotinate-nicotinamide nucleotide adenylyltransferase [Phycisphaerales bacterium]|nr:nicotinate-nicotinamide nucleotide adenylyltransferase [Phycisphaerales bacterium]
MPAAEPTPLDIPADAKHIVLFGGTFDPPHQAHTLLADLARREIERRHACSAWLVFVPAARSPHKDSAPHATDAQRVEMLRLATDGIDRCTVWTDETDRATSGEPSYWLTTLQRARVLLGDRALSFIIGSDQAASFHRWREPRTMLDLAAPVVLPREPIISATSLREAMARAGFWREREIDAWVERLIVTDAVAAASTEVREAHGAQTRTPVHPAVAEYARVNKLYAKS